MDKLNNIIKEYTWKDYKKEFMHLMGQAISSLAVDDKRDLDKLLCELDLVITAYRYKLTNGEEISIDETETEYQGEDIIDVLNNEYKEEQLKEKIIPIQETPLYTYRIYDGKKYTVPEDVILESAKIQIPADNIYEYYMKVKVAADNVLYTEKTEFQKEYVYLKAAYIRTQTAQEDDRSIINKNFDELVDTSLLENENRIVKWEDNEFKTYARPKSDERIRLEGNRQRMLDNRNIRFMYDIDGTVFHDKSCKCVKEIELKQLRGNENPPKNKKPCEECLLDMYIRKGCGDDFNKNQNIYRHFFTKGEVSMDTIKEFLQNNKACFRIESVNKMKLTFNEDTWKIETDGRGNFIKLWHNNYFVDKRGRRHIDSTEFHEQKTDMIMDVQMAVQYIMDYSYKEKHN